MPKQQNSNDSGCVCVSSTASSTHQSARLPVSILRNICICCVTGTACSALDRLLHLLTDSLESFGSCRDFVPEPHAMPNQASSILSVPGYFFSVLGKLCLCQLVSAKSHTLPPARVCGDCSLPVLSIQPRYCVLFPS